MMFRLALQLGKTIEELDEMPSSEFTEWCAFYQLEPWGTDREDWRAGMQASVVANVNRSSKTPEFKPQDFMPQKEKKQTLKQMRAVFKTLTGS